MKGLNNQFWYEKGEFKKRDKYGFWSFEPTLSEGLICLNVSFQVQTGRIIDKRVLAVVVCGQKIEFNTTSAQAIEEVKKLYHELVNSIVYKEQLSTIAEGFKQKIEGEIIKSKWVIAEIN